MTKNPLNDLGETLGDYVRDQRRAAQLSLRQLSAIAGISNPYLSQIERGLRKPSAEILSQLAKGLQVSAESLYVRAGFLDAEHVHDAAHPDVPSAIKADPDLTKKQKDTLLEIYRSFLAANPAKPATPTTTAPATKE